MSKYGYDALVSAAEDAEREGNWRRAYGFWADAIAEYGSDVSSALLSYWEMHQEMCRQKMK